MQWNSDIKYCVGLLHLNLVINYIIKSRDEAQHRLFLSNKDLDEFIERSEADILTILTHEEWHHFLLKNKNRKQNTSREKMTRCRFPMMTITDPRESKQQIITWITKDSRHKHANLTASPDEALHVMAGIYLHDTVFFFFLNPCNNHVAMPVFKRFILWITWVQTDSDWTRPDIHTPDRFCNFGYKRLMLFGNRKQLTNIP